MTHALQSLPHIDIVMSIFNQETLLPRVLEGVLTHTTTPFTLILIFDGCTDQSREVSERYLDEHSTPLLKKLIIQTAPNVFETRANNRGFREATSAYLITIQDDVIIEEKGWERRLTYPLRAYADIFAVTSRVALTMRYEHGDIVPRYSDCAGREYWSLPRSTFAIRNTINRGPIAFRSDVLRTLNYLDERFAPGQFDEADLVLRAYEQFGMHSGAFSIDYRSDVSWGKTRSGNNPITSRDNTVKNATLLKQLHPALSSSSTKHLYENRTISDSVIDWNERDSFITRSFVHIRASCRFFQLFIVRTWREQRVRIKSFFLPKYQ